MTLADFCEHCQSLPGAEGSTPFGPEVLVYKVGGKMFAAAVSDELPHRVNLKCDPERAVELRDRHGDIVPGYHMNKRHWNTLTLPGKLPSKLVRELTDTRMPSWSRPCRGRCASLCPSDG